jgi:uncharacterized protein
MSKTFIKDPREVVKPGDIVKVKVLQVEANRKRIALSLRLDDETNNAKKEANKEARNSRDSSRATSREPSSKPAAQSGGGALADALRRASEKNDRGKTRP